MGVAPEDVPEVRVVRRGGAVGVRDLLAGRPAATAASVVNSGVPLTVACAYDDDVRNKKRVLNPQPTPSLSLPTGRVPLWVLDRTETSGETVKTVLW